MSAPTIPWKLLRSEVQSKIDNGSKFLLAISGGVDSMVLLTFFRRTFNPNNFAVAHFNHGIRDESNIEERYIQEYCKEEGISVIVGYGHNLKESQNQEEEARDQRWNFLERCANWHHCSHVVTGHHLNDNIENFLFRMMRGSELESFTMKKENEINGIIRYKPFLEIKKDSIIQFATRTSLKWFEDHTNQESTHMRNKIRNELIPYMNSFFNLEKTIPRVISEIDSLKK